MELIVNPGTSPLPGSTFEQAKKNMERFVIDCLDPTIEQADAAIYTFPPSNEVTWSVPDHQLEYWDEVTQTEGRFHFVLCYEDRSTLVAMPGLPEEQVRFLGAAGQNVWVFPRLYVDGSSWLWMYAIHIARHVLFGEPEEFA